MPGWSCHNPEGQGHGKKKEGRKEGIRRKKEVREGIEGSEGRKEGIRRKKEAREGIEGSEGR